MHYILARPRIAILFALLFAMSGILFVGHAQAATIAVTTTAMTSSPTECNLVDAVKAANTNIAVNACAAGDPLPATDNISLPAGTYNTALIDNMTLPDALLISESVHLTGADKAQTVLAFASNGTGAQLSYAPNTSTQNNFAISNLTLSGPAVGQLSAYFDLHMSDTTGSAISIDNVVCTNFDIYAISYGSSVNSLAITDAVFRSTAITVYQSDASTISTSLSDVDTKDINTSGSQVTFSSISRSTHNGDVTIKNSEFDGTDNFDPASMAIYNDNTGTSSKLNIINSRITGYGIGIGNYECTNLQNLYSVYLTNSSIGGTMNIGVDNQCGHLVIHNSTFHDIHGTAIIVRTNTINGNYVNGYTQHDSQVESYSSTYTRITADSQDTGTPLTGLLVLYAEQGSGHPEQTLETTSSLTLKHNTFAGNTLGATGAIVTVTDGTVLKDLILQNNAMEGLPLSGVFSVTNAPIVSGNMTTSSDYSGSYAAGFIVVPEFKLGQLGDNGGSDAIGVHGRLGNIQTMRPLYGSPLINGASSSAGLTTDQRNQPRFVLGAYDVGAVETTLAEYTADGGVWSSSGGLAAELVKTGARLTPYTLIAAGIIVIASLIYSSKRHTYRLYR